jgi:hypothetical protein
MIEGKGLWVWRVDQLLTVYKTLTEAVESAVRCGYSHVLVKVANGWYPWLPDTYEGRKIPEFIRLCREHGLLVVLWHYSYCHTVTGETSAARRAIGAYGDGVSPYVWDVEIEYKKNGNGEYYKAITGNLRASFPDMKQGYSSFRFPSLHQELDWDDLTEASDFTIPQVYWEGAHNPAAQLQRTVDEYAKFSDIPLYAAGAAYENRGWKPTDEECDEFSEAAHALGIEAINWWRWDTAITLSLWDTLCAQDWDGGTTPPLTDKEKLDRLWAAHPELHGG